MIIDIHSLKEIIGRLIIRKGGIPKVMIKYIIEDLIKLGLLERLNFMNYKIIESNCDREIRTLLALY